MASILVHLPAGAPGPDPDPDKTAARDLRVVEAWDDSVIGVVGWSSGGLDALRSVCYHPEIDRLAIVSTPFPDDLPDDVDLISIQAKTLLLFGSADPSTGSRHGHRWQRALPNARLEMVPGAGDDLLAQMWGRVLSHLAPRRKKARQAAAR